MLPACVATGARERDRGTAAAWTPGLQLYTLGDAPAQDLEGTLRAVAAIGYRAVELATDYGRSARQLRQALDGAGLVCPSVHVQWQPFPRWWVLGGDPAPLIEKVTTVGARYVVTSSTWLSEASVARFREAVRAPEPRRAVAAVFGSLSLEDWTRAAEVLNEQGALLARAGLRLAYHNHGWEFVTLPHGGTAFDLLVERTDPALVDFQLDIGHAAAAGHDPVALLARLGRRVRLMHLRDVKQPAAPLVPADLGTGIIDWEQLIPAVRRAEIPHLFVEQDPPFPVSPMASVRVAYAFLSAAFARAG